jgi:hypothetical protein
MAESGTRRCGARRRPGCLADSGAIGRVPGDGNGPPCTTLIAQSQTSCINDLFRTLHAQTTCYFSMPLSALSQRGQPSQRRQRAIRDGPAGGQVPPQPEGALPFSGDRSARSGTALTGDRDAWPSHLPGSFVTECRRLVTAAQGWRPGLGPCPVLAHGSLCDHFSSS